MSSPAARQRRLVFLSVRQQPVSAACCLSPQRCHSKCVSEATFYRLVQSFAVVLFE